MCSPPVLLGDVRWPVTLGRFSPSGGRVRRDKVGTLCGVEGFFIAVVLVVVVVVTTLTLVAIATCGHRAGAGGAMSLSLCWGREVATTIVLVLVVVVAPLVLVVIANHRRCAGAGGATVVVAAAVIWCWCSTLVSGRGVEWTGGGE